jgi:hypothetical protein
MATPELDLVDKLWPGRGIFQGGARSYINYCEATPFAWNCYEKPLWLALLALVNLSDRYILDVGAGSGKLIETMIGVERRRQRSLHWNQIRF